MPIKKMMENEEGKDINTSQVLFNFYAVYICFMSLTADRIMNGE
jgi:hypothetical protein